MNLTRVWLGTICLAVSCGALAQRDPLPAEADVRRALLQSPAVQAARYGAEYEAATRQRLESGPYEWTLRAGYAQRNEVGVTRFNEADIGLERGLRWWWKGRTDRQIGDEGVNASDAAVADAWHEESRTLLSLWFEVIRSAASADHLQRQLQLAEDFSRGVAIRVDKGEVRPLDHRLSMAEVEAIRARLLQAEQQLSAHKTHFSVRYPDLPLPESTTAIPEPLPQEKSENDWIKEIIGHNHEIELAEAEARRSALAAVRASEERVPDLTLGTRYSHERDGRERVLGFTVSLPLGLSSRTAAADQAHARAGEFNERTREIHRKVEMSAKVVSSDARARWEIWRSLKGASEAAAQNAASLLRGYTLGETSLSESILAQRQSIDSSLEAVKAAADAWQAAARLRLDAHEIWAYKDHHQSLPLKNEVP